MRMTPKKKKKSFFFRKTIRKISLNPFSMMHSAASTPVLTKSAGLSKPILPREPRSSATTKTGRGFVPLSPRVLMRPFSSRGFLEPPITIDDTLEDGEIVDLSLIEDELPSASKKRKFPSEETKGSKKFKPTANVSLEEPYFILDQTGSTDDHLLPPAESPEIIIVCETKLVGGITPRRSVRFKSPAVKTNGQPRREKNKKKTSTGLEVQDMPPPPSPATIQARHNFSANPEISTNFASGISLVKGGVFEFNANKKRPFPTMGTKQRSRADVSGGQAMSNVYVPVDAQRPRNKKGSLRPIIIDGSNVAMGHGKFCDFPGKQVFSCRGIDICVDYFKRRGHEEVVAFVPHFRIKAGQAVEPEILHRLERSKNVILTPSRDTSEGRFQVYDDRYICQYAAMNGGIIVSNDQYRDLLSEGLAIRKAIEERQLMFNWMPGNILMFPTDPLGKNGPNLDDFLKF